MGVIGIGGSGKGYRVMDTLRYFYSGNRLSYVHDNGNQTEGFVNANSGTDDYDYDFNGNLDKDKNKGISTKGNIKYNYLNLPKEIIRGTESIKYIYDGSGRKLRQEVYSNNGGTLVKYTDYIGELVYEGGNLQFIHHPEGRVLPDGGGWEYQYHLKDHLGNVRVTFTGNPQTPLNYTANLENGNASSGEGVFGNYASTTFDLVDHTDPGTTYQRVQWLNGGASGRVGLTKSLSVMPGDRLSVTAYAKYRNLTGTGNTNPFAAALTAAFGVSSGSTGEQLKLYNSLNAYGVSVAGGNHPADDDTAPKAFVTILLFDNNYNLLDAAWDQVTTTLEQVSATNKEAFDHALSKEVIVQEAGYAYIFVSNEHPTYVDVYFDDVTVGHTLSPIVSSSDYYPFGLTFNSYQRENSVKNQHLYNDGSERQDELDLNVDFTEHRVYDPAMGRWWQVDPLSDLPEQIAQSPYQFGWNNPIRYNDPNGDCPCLIPAVPWLVTAFEVLIAGTATYIAYDAYDRSKFKAETLQIHNEGSFLNNSDPRKPNFNPTKRVALIGTAMALVARLIEKNAKYFGADPREVQNSLTNMSESELQFFINHHANSLPSDEDRKMFARQYFGVINPELVNAATIYDFKKDVYSLERGLTPEEKAAEEEEKQKGQKANQLLSNFSNVEEGTYTWNGTDWVLDE